MDDSNPQCVNHIDTRSAYSKKYLISKLQYFNHYILYANKIYPLTIYSTQGLIWYQICYHWLNISYQKFVHKMTHWSKQNDTLPDLPKLDPPAWVASAWFHHFLPLGAQASNPTKFMILGLTLPQLQKRISKQLMNRIVLAPRPPARSDSPRSPKSANQAPIQTLGTALEQTHWMLYLPPSRQTIYRNQSLSINPVW